MAGEEDKLASDIEKKNSEGTSDDKETIPTGTLSSVTKKQKEIEELLPNLPVNTELIKTKFTEYLTRIDNLYELCNSDTKREWLSKHETTIKNFRERMEAILYPVKTHSAKKSFSNRSSVMSDAKIQLAQQKAKVAAQRSSLEQSLRLEEEEMKLKNQMLQIDQERRKIKQQQDETELKILEDEFLLLDNGSSGVSSLGSERSAPAKEKKTLVKITDESPDTNKDALSVLTLNHERLIMPKTEMQKFDGTDITKYRSFILKFERTIESKCSNETDKLIYLEQFTDGKPLQIIQSCNHFQPAEAFKKAKALLNEEYGNEYAVANEYMKKLDQWPEIKSEDSNALHDLAIFLTNCSHYMENMACGNTIKSPQEIMRIVKKLPFKLRERWRRVAHDKLRKNSQVSFTDLVEFVSSESSILRRPLFGNIVDEPRDKKTKSRTFVTTSSDDNKQKCECCKMSNHSITGCHFFRKKSYDEKKDFILRSGLCFSCLMHKHRSKFCKIRATCDICKKKHPTIMHDDSRVPRPTEGDHIPPAATAVSSTAPTNNTNNEGTPSAPDAAVTVASTRKSAKKIRYPVMPARLILNNKEVIVNVVLDSCSSDCWLNESILSKLNIKCEKENIPLTTMAQKASVTCEVLNNLIVSDLDGNFSIQIPVTYTTNESQWPFNKGDIPRESDIADLEYLKNTPFNFIEENISLLIGMNVPSLHKTYEVTDRLPHEPYASRHELGWALNGPMDEVSHEKSCHRMKIERQDTIDSQLETFFNQDFIDNDKNELVSQNDEKWMQKVSSSINKVKGHYEIDLPFKEENPSFPDNRSQALRRFHGIEKRMNNNNKYAEDYAAFMTMMIREKFVEVVPEAEVETVPGKKWYLVHHGIYHKQKNKLRIVFDCSLKYEGICLNDQLYQGPDLLNNLVGILLRFREHSCAFTGDIEKMYYQVKIPPKDRNYMRFFWYNENKTKIMEFRLTVHVFGAVSSPSVANYALRRAAMDSNCSQEVKDAVRQNFYVDDLVKSTVSENQAVNLITELKNVLSESGFNLTAFSSNSSKVLQYLPEKDIVLKKQEISLQNENNGPTTSNLALGVKWNTIEDTLGFNIKVRSNTDEKIVTKRTMLKIISSIYDPLGLAAPVIIVAKRVFQECCKLNLDWDSVVPENVSKRWEDSLESLQQLKFYNVPRCVTVKNAHSMELHTFCDGSEVGYAATSFIKCTTTEGVSIERLFCKSRLTPLSNKTLRTIPRVELCGAKLAAEIVSKIKHESNLPIKSFYFWTDSSIVLCYIKNETARFQRFVSNKVSFIRSISLPTEWFFVPSNQNPADIASRGVSASKLTESKLWSKGPDFLLTDTYPEQKISEIKVGDPEVSTKTIITKVESDTGFDKLLKSTSNWNKLKCRIATFVRFKSYLCKRQFSKERFLTEELKAAENILFKYSQRTSYKKLLMLVEEKKTLPKTEPVRKLSPFLDASGLLRVGGRIQNSSLEFDVKHPIILCSKSPIVKIMLEHTHRSLGHTGCNVAITKLRKRFHIIGGLKSIKKLVRECITCRKYQARPSTQIMGNLPPARVEADEPAFSSVGIDCFGPFHVSIGRRSEKRYGLILICMSTKAVHIENLNSLSSDSFINGLRRFISRRGNVRRIFSDNATNFKGAESELKEAAIQWNQSASDFLNLQHIQWHYNPPSASHHGGLWERHIRSIRKILNGLMIEQKVKLSDDNLSTLFCEIEAILNSRPICAIDDNRHEQLPLTPNDLLLLNSGITFPPGIFSKNDTYSSRRWRQIQHLSQVFWARWKTEYLTTLNQRQKWQNKKRSIEKGDLVLVIDAQAPRNCWPLAIVDGVVHGRDNQVRSCTVRLAKFVNSDRKSFGTFLLNRPITKLILLREIENL